MERLGFDENFLDVTHLVSEQLAKMETTDKVVGHTYRTQEEGHGSAVCLHIPNLCYYLLIRKQT